MLNKIKKQLNNLALKRKLLLLIMAILFAMSAVALISVEYINRANQDMLYRALSSSLEYLSFSMEKELNSYVNVSSEILANDTIQSVLGNIKDDSKEESKILYMSDNNRLSKILDEYYYEIGMNNLLYISLINPLFTSYTSFGARGTRVPKSLEETLEKGAAEGNGRPVWVTEFADPYGLLLTRSIRRIDKLALDDLGTITMSVDIRRMVEETIEKIALSDDLLFALYDMDGNVFLCNEEVEKDEMTRALRSLEGDYGVVETAYGEYFISKGNVGEYNWGYSFSISYDDIMQKIHMAKIICIITILCSACFAVLVADKMVSSITGHFNLLIHKMVAFGEDDSSLPEVEYDYSDRKDEIGSLHNQFDIMAERIITLINENYKKELLNKDMEFKALQNQINPHFLYNTLNSINWKAKSAGEYQIAEMVQALGTLLRSSLEDKEKEHTIRSELEIAESYMTIQQIRFGERLSFGEEIEEGTGNIKLPLLTIQPILENAVSYGLEESIDGCEVILRVFRKDEDVLIQVINNGTRFEERFMEKLIGGEVLVHGFGIGMLNIHKRIQMAFGPEYGLFVCNPDMEHAMVQIRIPGKDE